jgi:dTDP-glucose 4,6-dehydratase
MNLDSQNYISFVEDRKGHDFRYAIDNSKINKELNWFPTTSFEDGILKTIDYYKNKTC